MPGAVPCVRGGRRDRARDGADRRARRRRHRAPRSRARLARCRRLAVVSQEIVHPRPLCEGGCRQTTTCSTEGSRMDVHQNARTTPYSRAVIAQRVQAGETVAAVARAFRVCERQWVQRAAMGELSDRSCRPHRSPRAISPAVMVEIQRLRQLGWTGGQIAEVVQVSRATVARTLAQSGLARLAALTERPPLVRYEWLRAGQLLHLSKSLAGLAASATALLVIATVRRAGSAGSSCMSVSTTARASPTPKFSPTSTAPRWRPSCAVRSPGFSAAASGSSAC